MTVETSLPIDSAHVEFTAVLVDMNSPPDAVDIALTDGKGSWKWKVQNIGFQKSDDSFLEFEELKAIATGGGGTAEAKLRVDGLIKGDKQTFTAHRNWSGFTMDPKWDQKIENFKNLVTVSLKARKAWGATKINLTGFVNGKAGGCPENGHRWGRALNLNHMQPDQYYDGNAWVALPAGFAPGATNYFGATFVKSGTKFVARYGGTWPETFADYDFNDAKYVKKRADWCQKAHDVWTDALMIKRKECRSDDGVRCCLYDTDLTMTITEVTTSGDDVIYMAPGGWRSDAGNFAFDDPDLKMAAHEAGHHLDNPDEYAGGAVDPTINTDGAVNGIDATTIMNSTELVKKRHYHGIVEMTKRIIKKKYGKDYVYEAID
ncbi:MAG: hypothetical protein FJW38_00845 [Acidobacteria bacterium]|nr:hypothetical protein [Acidobacteriota bacterium]